MYFTGTLCRKVVLNRVFIMWLNSLTFLGLSRNTSRKALEFSRDLTGIWHRNRANFPAISLPNIFQKPLEFFRGLPGTFPKIIWTFSGNFSQNNFPKSAELFLGISPEYGTETVLISQRFPSRISSRNRSNFSGDYLSYLPKKSSELFPGISLKIPSQNQPNFSREFLRNMAQKPL